MQLDARLSRMLHILIHMDRLDGPMTSELAAQMLRTNPVVVRRTMAGLRDAGYVRSEKGHGGGWTLARPLDAIRILDIYRAVGEPRIFSIGPADPNPQCLVEQAVNGALEETLGQARDLIAARFAAVTLGDLSRDFDDRFAAGRGA